MDTTRLTTSHPSGDTLENYALGLLSESELARVETHLFVCHTCQDALVETDNYVAAMKAAMAQPATSPKTSRWMEFIEAVRFARPIPAFGTALATLAVAAILVQNYTPTMAASEAEITLRSVRGGLEFMGSEGPANSRMLLKIQSQQLRNDQNYRVQIVNAIGTPLWDGAPQFSQESGPVLHVDKGLGPGNYWVRLYDPQHELLQEYGLKLK